MNLLADLNHQLEQQRAQLASSNPELYRHLALYLQVLRAGLLNAVQQACFHLATERYPQRYGALEPSQRRRLHQRLVNLVARTSSLLTVEQLAQLASQLEKERRRELQAGRRRLLSAFESAAQAEPSPEGSPQAGRSAAPEGSVHLGLALPLTPELFASRAFPGLLPMAAQPEAMDPEPDAPAGEQADPASTAEFESGPGLEALEAMQAMVAAFGDVFAGEADGGDVDGGDAEGGDPADDDGDLGKADNAVSMAPWDQGALPTDPVDLMVWLDGFERALVRRLRNLSHAINVDLLRIGLSRSLLPLNLLDAVLKGQIETQAAPANVLSLPLPLGSQALPHSLETASILIRLSDLELDQPKLRTCRSRLQQQRQEVRRMAQHYRRLRRRLQGLEAEQLWLQDVSTATKPSP